MSGFWRVEAIDGATMYINLDRILWVHDTPAGEAVVFFSDGESVNVQGAEAKRLIEALPLAPT
jgi:hypothetical protein